MTINTAPEIALVFAVPLGGLGLLWLLLVTLTRMWFK